VSELIRLLRRRRGVLVGMVHLLPLPGAPRAAPMGRVLARARDDARALAAGGADALLVENYGDAPFHAERAAPETIAAMARALEVVRAAARARPIGVNVLRNDARAALGLAVASELDFVRVNVHVGVAATDQGLIAGRAAETLRERARLGRSVAILADVHVKHARALWSDDIAQAAEDTLERGLADALIVSGAATGRAPAPEALERVRERLPRALLLVGSGLAVENAAELLEHADGAIVGSALERGGRAGNPVERARVAALARALARLSQSPA
jgi:membrane complex biogenesis BtpA family protein